MENIFIQLKYVSQDHIREAKHTYVGSHAGRNHRNPVETITVWGVLTVLKFDRCQCDYNASPDSLLVATETEI